MKNLYTQLKTYAESDYYPLHMPGHKRNQELVNQYPMYQMDITEIQGFDNLHHAKGILQEAMEEAARIYHAEHTYFLVNGSTSGLLTAISAVTNLGDRIIVARNSHKAIYHAAMIRNLECIYAYPNYIEEYEINGSVEPEIIEALLKEYPDAKGVIITSPTMEGVVSDIETIARICHVYNVPLLVDEAHGAHFGFTREGMANSNQLGADLVIQSVHKTLPSLTQTALLHVNGQRVSMEAVKQYLQVYQTSSPSYLLMGSIVNCNEHMKLEASFRLAQRDEMVAHVWEASKRFQYVRILQAQYVERKSCYAYDIGKLLISVKNTHFTGQQLYDILLDEYQLQLEMAGESYVLAIVTGYDTIDGIVRLIQALEAIDKSIVSRNEEENKKSMSAYLTSMARKATMSIYDALRQDKTCVPLALSSGRISATYISIYPPGVPVLVPGEQITREICDWMKFCIESGMNLQGLEDDKEIAVISIIV